MCALIPLVRVLIGCTSFIYNHLLHHEQNIFNLYHKQMVSPGQGEGAGSAGATINETKQDLKKGVEHLQKVTYQLRKRKVCNVCSCTCF